MKAHELTKALLATIDPKNHPALTPEELFADERLQGWEVIDVFPDGTVIIGVDKQSWDADGLNYESEARELKFSITVRELDPETIFPREKPKEIAGFADCGSMTVKVPE